MSGETLSGGTVSLPVKPETKGFGAKLSEGILGESSGLKGLGAKLGGMLVGGLALVGVGASIGEVFKTGFDEAKDASAGMVQLAAGIKSTGNAANVSVSGMENLASSIQGMSGQTDDSIVKAEQLMLTFTNIKNVGPDKIFDQATLAAANMAAKLGGDASSQAILLGKALNDPVKGLTALTRVGVSFTSAQKDQIAAMVKTGDTIGAQKVILKELNTEFGGAAAAAGQSLPGSLARTKRAFEDISQTIVEAFMPVVAPAINGVANALHAALPFVTEFSSWLSGKLTAAVAIVGPAVSGLFALIAHGDYTSALRKSLGLEEDSPLVSTILSIRDAFGAAFAAIGPIFKQLEPALAPLIPQVIQLAAAFSPLGLMFHALLPVLPQLVAGIAPLAAQLGGALVHVLTTLMPVLTSLVKVLVGELAGIFKILVPLVVSLASAIGPILGNVLKALVPVITIVATFIGQVMKVIEPLIPVVLRLVAALLPLLAPLLQLVSVILVPLIDLFAQLLKPILNLVTSLLTMLIPVITVLIHSLATILPPVLTALMPIIAAVASIFGDILGPAIKGITQILGGIIDFITGVFTGNWSRAWKGITEVFSGIWNSITGIVKGVVNGIIDLIDGVIKGVNSIGGAVGIHVGVIPHLAEGATVLPTPGGTIVRVAEAGRAESVVDTGKLNKLIDQATNGGGGRGGNTFNIFEATNATAVAQAVLHHQAAAAV